MWVLKVVFLVTLLLASWAKADEIKTPEEGADPVAELIRAQTDEVKVVFDITRGVQKAKIIKDGQVVSEHKISGAKNKAIVVKGAKFCAFTTTGKNIKPSYAHKSYYSKEHDVSLAHFVTFDYGRGIGAHHYYDIKGYSSGCIRQTAAGAKAVYDVVVANSEKAKGSTKLKSTNVTFDVIDNTPGRYTAECDCLKNHMRDTKSDRAINACRLAATEEKSSTKVQSPEKTVSPKKSTAVKTEKAEKPVKKAEKPVKRVKKPVKKEVKPISETVAPVKKVEKPRKKKTIFDLFRKKPKLEEGGLY